MLECKDLVKTYRNKAAVDHLSLQVKPGRIYALLGPNGSGKTTFMKMAAGLVKPNSGELLFEGQPIGVYSKAHTAYMPTEAYFYPYMTGADAGKYYQDFFEDFDPDKYARLLETMNLDPKQKVSKMSSGMMAKLKIALNLSSLLDDCAGLFGADQNVFSSVICVGDSLQEPLPNQLVHVD